MSEKEKPERKSSAKPLTPDLAAKVRALVEAGGHEAAADRLDITQPTLLRALGGLAVSRAIRAQIELRLLNAQP